jgi:peptide/nickel transport system permease protein
MSSAAVADQELVDAHAARASRSPRILMRLLRRRIAAVCIAYLVVLVGIGALAPLLLPGVMHEQAGDLLAVRQGPSWAHLLGTDSLGRDLLNRLLVGTQPTIVGVAEALAVVLALAVPVGLAAGFFGGLLDRVVSWLADLVFGLPGIIIVLVVLSVFPGNMLAAMVTLGALSAPGLMRIVRSATLPIRQELYIAAAEVSGLSKPYIVARHVLPRIAGVVIVQASFFAAAAVLVQAGLAYLGLVAPPPAPSWGGMVNEGVGAIVLQPWLIWPPGIAMVLTVLALGLLGDEVRDATAEGWSGPSRRKPARPASGTAGGPAPVRSIATDAILAVAGLRVEFPMPTGSVAVVDDVSFEIAAGETVGLIGESGCGKTMTAMSILRLLPTGGEITGGRILFAGRDLAALPERDLIRVRGREIGLISQEPMVSLNPTFRVGSQIADALRLHHGLTRRAARARAVELLGRVRLPEPDIVARRYPHELSGGIAQRVSIARALAGEPRLLIADEPTTALDVTVQAEILELLRELQQERGMAVLLVSHDWGVIADLCDRAVVMYAGQVVERAELRPIFRQPLHPYTEALLASNPHEAQDAQVLPTIPGNVPRPGRWPVGCHFNPRCRYATGACREQPIPLVRPTTGRETRCIHHEQLALRG